jgi:hypothetical protein
MLNRNLLISRQIQFSLDELSGYGEYMETFIRDRIERFEEESSVDELKKHKDTNPEYYYWMIDDLAERWREVHFVFPNNFRYAFFAQIYSALEVKLQHMVGRHIKEFSTDLKVGKNLSYVGKSKHYLELAGLDLSDTEDDFLFIDSLKLIRNQIMHENGYITPSSKGWKAICDFVLKNSIYLRFEPNPFEIQEDGKPLYESNPNFRFQMIFSGPNLNNDFFAKVKSIFLEVGKKPLF